jgi:tRNA threonylcarbamoyladenosine biosynthesis protein TsaE
MIKYISNNEIDTKDIAYRFSSLLKPKDIVFLYGDLGLGKTYFCKHVICNLLNNPETEVPSPTYTLVQTYQMDQKTTIWHFDLYRIKTCEEVYELGWEEALYDGITLIEWPEKLENLAPKDRLDVVFTNKKTDNNFRQIELVPHGTWEDRILTYKDKK